MRVRHHLGVTVEALNFTCLHVAEMVQQRGYGAIHFLFLPEDAP